MTEPLEPTEHVGALDDPVAPADAVESVFGVDAEGGHAVDGAEIDPASVQVGPRRYPSTIGGACYLMILVAAVTALGIIVAGDWRVGVRVLSAALASAGAVRLLLPQRDAGMLAVRHRMVDVLMLASVAGLLWWLAGSIPDQPAS